jgi:hypothetical protein
MKYTADNVDITCIQEPYTLQRRVVRVPKQYTLTAGEDRSRAAIIVTNNRIDATLIKLSDADAVTVEITRGDLKNHHSKHVF